MKRIQLLSILLGSCFGCGNAFAPPSYLTTIRRQLAPDGPLLLHAEPSSSSSFSRPNTAPSNNNNADFEYQEMRAILDAMQRQGIRDLASPGKGALENYVRRVVAQRRPSTTTRPPPPP